MKRYWELLLNKIILEKNNLQQLSIKDYVEKFSKIVNINILEITEFNNKINSGNLFPVRDFLYENLHSKQIENVLSFFYFFDEIDLNEFLFEVKSDFFKIDKPSYLFKTINFSPEILLSKNERERLLIYLFLYFLPVMPKNWLLKHPIQNEWLILFPEITNENFELLYELMNLFSKEDLNNFEKEHGICIKLMEKFLKENRKTLMFAKKEIIIKNLPKQKLLNLFKNGCFFNGKNLPPELNKYYENIDLIMLEIEFTYKKEKMEAIIAPKNNEKIIIKI